MSLNKPKFVSISGGAPPSWRGWRRRACTEKMSTSPLSSPSSITSPTSPSSSTTSPTSPSPSPHHHHHHQQQDTSASAHYIKLHAPWSVLCRLAEELNLRAPLQVFSPLHCTLHKTSPMSFLSLDLSNYKGNLLIKVSCIKY